MCLGVLLVFCRLYVHHVI